MGRHPLLPKEYQQVEYIESHGAEYIQLGEYDNDIIGISAEFVSITGENALLGGTKFELFSSPSRNYSVTLWSNRSVETEVPAMFRFSCLIDYNCKTFTVNGKTYVHSELTNAYRPKYMFCNSPNSYSARAKVYQYYELEDDTYRVLLVPCYRKSDVEIGMYDVINGVFYTNKGAGHFAKGSNV